MQVHPDAGDLRCIGRLFWTRIYSHFARFRTT
jgi:hypothetical protein